MSEQSDAQLARLASLLRDVARSGGKDRWSHLHSHGHKFQTVNSALRQGYLREPQSYNYELTEDGRAYLMAKPDPTPPQ
jgi:hypothetical protein